MGHGWAVHAIVALVIATAFLVWVGGKDGNPYQKFGKFIGWIAVILTSLIVLSSVVMCVNTVSKGGFPCMRGGMMQEKMGPMMGPMAMPPAPEGQKK